MTGRNPIAIFRDRPSSQAYEIASPRESARWRVTVENGIHWLVAPDGAKFYGCGLNAVDAGSPPEEVAGRPAYYLWNLYSSIDDWAGVIR